MRSACDQSTLPIDVQVFHCKARDPHVEAWRVGCHLSRPPRHSTEVPNHMVYERRVRYSINSLQSTTFTVPSTRAKGTRVPHENVILSTANFRTWREQMFDCGRRRILTQPSSHTPGLALHTTVAGKYPSSPEDKQEKQGESRDG
ncbi:uncharacterized protein TNCV_3123341 [Trichonephila clavipes]|nr:uncharacterized protein TNCV_3123341 [Trichonephila clavipes]